MKPNRPNFKTIVLRNIPDSRQYRLVIASNKGVEVDRTLPEDSKHLSTPSAFLASCAQSFTDAGEGTVIVDQVPCVKFAPGVAEDDSLALAAFAEQAAKDGWKPGVGVELGNGWVSWTKDKKTYIHMGIRSLITPDPKGMVRPADTDPVMLAYRLCRYAELVGAPWRARAGVSGLQALRNLYQRPIMQRRNGKSEWVKRPLPMWHWRARTGYDELSRLHGAGDMTYTRPLSELHDWELKAAYMVPLDTRAQYLNGMSQAFLGWDLPEHTGVTSFDPMRPGFWTIYVGIGDEIPAWARPELGIPLINPMRIRPDGTTTVTTRVLSYLQEVGQRLPMIMDSYLCKAGGRYLREFSELIRDALPDAQTAGDEILRHQIKQTYKESPGMFAKAGGRIERKDWYHAIVDECRVGVLRKAHMVARSEACSGRWPVRINTDCLWYPSFTPDARDLLEALGQNPDEPPRIGQFKVEKDKVMPMAEWYAEVCKQEEYRARKAAERAERREARR